MGEHGEWAAEAAAAPLQGEEGCSGEAAAAAPLSTAAQDDERCEVGGKQPLTTALPPSPCALLAGTTFVPKRPVREKCCAEYSAGGMSHEGRIK